MTMEPSMNLSKAQVNYFNQVYSTNTPKIIKRIGGGTYGDVFLASQNGKIYAVKRLKPGKEEKSIAYKQYTEILAAKMFKHENLMITENIYIQNGLLHLQMEFCDLKLEQLYEQKLNIDQRKTIYRQCLRGLEYLENIPFVHCDIKKDNILAKVVHFEGKTRYVVKIADYGLGVFIKEAIQSPSSQYAWTPGYRPPEVMAGYYELLPQADVWSMGVTFLQLLTGENAFFKQKMTEVAAMEIAYGSKLTELYKSLFNGEQPLELVPELRKVQNENEREFLAKMLQFDPRKRLKASELLNTQFLKFYESGAEIIDSECGIQAAVPYFREDEEMFPGIRD